MKKLIKFGEDVETYDIPVLNEREIRASAGILFLMMFFSIMFVLFQENFLLLKYSVIIFLADFIIRVFINPKFSPTLILGRLIVSNQSPEYVWAEPKKFAWTIGFVLAIIMFTSLVVINAHSPITGIICIICLVFLFFETAFGICLGCLFYPIFYKEKAHLCSGNTCEVKVKQDIQKTSSTQVFVVLGFIVFIFVSAFLFNNSLEKKPNYFLGITSSEQTYNGK